MDTRDKRCSACGCVKRLDSFHLRRGARDGRQSQCRECAVEISRRWRANNSDRVARNNRQWRTNNPEASKASVDSWRARNRERYNESQRAWQKRNRDRLLEQRRADRAANPEKYREALAAWKAANRDRVRDYQRKRRAAGYGGAIGSVDGDLVWDQCGGRCGLCGEPIDRSLPWPDPESASLDHILPLSKGGSHDQDNVQWAHLVCNLRKGDRAA